MDELTALMMRVKDRDEGAFEKLYSALRPRIWAFLYHLGAGNDADDLTEEALFTVWYQADSFDYRASVSTFAFAVARNKCNSALKLRYRTAQRMSVLNGNAMQMLPANNRSAPDASVRNADVGKSLANALDRLQHAERECIVLIDMEDFSVEEAARIRNCDVATVKASHARARTKLRGLLTPEQLGQPGIATADQGNARTGPQSSPTKKKDKMSAQEKNTLISDVLADFNDYLSDEAKRFHTEIEERQRRRMARDGENK